MKFEQFLAPLLSNWPCLALLIGFYVRLRFLGLPSAHFHSLVFFIGGAEFKSTMPGNVLNRDLTGWIKNNTATILDPAAGGIANARLESVCQSTDRKTVARNHLKSLNTRNA